MIFRLRAIGWPCSSAASNTTRWPIRRYRMWPEPSVEDGSMPTSVWSSWSTEPIRLSTSYSLTVPWAMVWISSGQHSKSPRQPHLDASPPGRIGRRTLQERGDIPRLVEVKAELSDPHLPECHTPSVRFGPVAGQGGPPEPGGDHGRRMPKEKIGSPVGRGRRGHHLG